MLIVEKDLVSVADLRTLTIYKINEVATRDGVLVFNVGLMV